MIGNYEGDRLYDALNGKQTPDNGDAMAKVLGTDADGTVWVNVAGGSERTPLETINSEVEPGDVVSVKIGNAGAAAIGNISNPAASTRHVELVQQTAESALSKVGQARADAEMAKNAAAEAAAVAEAVGQHFWAADDGIHVTEIEQDEFVEDPSGANILENANGILLRDGETWLSQFTPGNVAFYDGEGNEEGSVVAMFGADGAMIGKSGESHQLLDYHSMRLVDRDGDTYFHVSDLRNENGIATITDTFINYAESQTLFALSADTAIAITKATVNNTDVSPLPTLEYNEQVNTTYAVFAAAPPLGQVVRITYTTSSSYAKAFTLGKRVNEPTAMSFVVGYECSATGVGSYAEGEGTTAAGRGSHAEGGSTYASGLHSHAEGLSTRSRGIGSHAEGNGTNASGEASHAEGKYAVASGEVSHAEGHDTVAQAHAAHAQNRGTVASSEAQTAIGRYNVEDANDAYALIVGNGSYSTRSNALAVAWDGSTTIGGSISTDPSIQFLTENDSVNTRALIQAHDSGTTNGHNLVVRAGGNLVAGGGEYATQRYGLGDITTLENAYIGADGAVYIETNADTIANRRTWTFGAGGALVGAQLEGIDSDATLSARKDINPLSWRDEDGTYIGQIRACQETDGRIGAALVARTGTSDTGGIKQNVLRLYADQAGNLTYSVSSPANFRKAIGIENSTTSTVADIAAAAANFEITAAQYHTNGIVATAWVTVKTTNALTAGTTYTVATLVSGKRPFAGVTNGSFGTPNSVYGNADVTNGGALRMRLSENLAAGSSFRIGATYILA